MEDLAHSHAESNEEYYRSEREYTQARHTVEEIEVRVFWNSPMSAVLSLHQSAELSCTPALLCFLSAMLCPQMLPHKGTLPE